MQWLTLSKWSCPLPSNSESELGVAQPNSRLKNQQFLRFFWQTFAVANCGYIGSLTSFLVIDWDIWLKLFLSKCKTFVRFSLLLTCIQSCKFPQFYIFHWKLYFYQLCLLGYVAGLTDHLFYFWKHALYATYKKINTKYLKFSFEYDKYVWLKKSTWYLH